MTEPKPHGTPGLSPVEHDIASGRIQPEPAAPAELTPPAEFPPGAFPPPPATEVEPVTPYDGTATGQAQRFDAGGQQQ